MKKVLIVLYYYHPYVSGLTICAKRLAEALAASGHQVTVVSTRYDASLPGREVINGVEVLRQPVLFRLGKGVISPSFIWKAIQLSRRHDIVNFHLPLADAGLISPWVDPAKIISTYQCDINLGPGFVSRLVQAASFFLMGLTLRRSRKIVASSHDYFSHCHYRDLSAKAVEIYPCVDTADFAKAKDAGKLRERLGIAPKTFVIGFVGRVVYEKGINFLLDSIGYLESEMDDYKVVIAGDYKKVAGGSVKKELDLFIERYPERVMFTGYLTDEDLRRFYSTIDVLVLPSIDPLEAFGMVQIEAMCCGVPVVATNMPGVRIIVTKTGFGALVEPKDSRGIATEVMKIRAAKPDDSGFVRADWDTATSARQYEDLFNEP